MTAMHTNENAELEWLRSQVAALEQLLEVYERTALEQTRKLEQAIEALREREQLSRSIIETAHDAYISIDAQGLLTDWNHQAEAIFGWPREEVMGRLLTETIIPPHYREAHQRGLRHFLVTGEGPVLNQRVEITALRRDGQEFPVEVTIWPIRVGSGYQFNAFVRDITERLQAAQTLQQANEQLQRSVNDLEGRTRESALLNEMSELIQSCLSLEESYTVIAQVAPKLFPRESGALYMGSASRNFVEAMAVWGDAPVGEQVFKPDECWALRRGRVHHVASHDSGFLCAHLRLLPPGRHLCVPMMAQGEVTGLLYLQSSLDTEEQPDSSQEQRLESRQQLAVTVAASIGLTMANLELRETLRVQSIRDLLTGLFNRRYMEESLERELYRAARNQASLGIVMLDLDHFKRFNDTFGHAAGDVVLRAVGGCLQTHIRREDIACRYGGEELLLIMPGASVDVARQRAEPLREAVKALTVHHLGQLLSTITISAGVAIFPEHGATADDLLQAADTALYRAKAEGRDRVVIG